MKKESEKVVERTLREDVEKMKGLCIKLLTQFFMGLPDRLILLPGKIIFFVETKSTGDEPKDIQKWVHKKIIDLGFDVYVLDTVEKVKTTLKKYE